MKEVVYKLLDTVTGGKGLRKTINGFSVKLPTRYVNYFPADYEQQNFSFLRKHVKQGDTIMDIGAHIGLFATAAAQLTGNNGKVYAFEPAAETNVLLKHTIAINQLNSIIESHKEAMGAAKAAERFFMFLPLKEITATALCPIRKTANLNAVEVDMLQHR
jgi:hypothetical protein